MTRGGAPAPDAVTFDAGGTLFTAAEPVGDTYARLARAAGIDADAGLLDDGFRRAFAAAPPLAWTADGPQALPDFERAWWRSIVDESLRAALGVADLSGIPASAHERFFAASFAHYAEPAAWTLDPDARPLLAALRARRVRLAVISNFDGRLHGLLAAFGLADLVDAAVASSEAGAAKPAPAIFAHTLRLLGDPQPERCVHVGDSLREDAGGATAAGLRAVWLDRNGAEPCPPRVTRVTRLAEVALVLAGVQSGT